MGQPCAAFIKLLEEGRQRCSMRILGYCLMDNHWHLILTLMRYVEAHPLRAGEGSAGPALAVVKPGRFGRQRGREGATHRLAGVSRPPRWEQQVHDLVDARTLERVPLSIARGRPFGDDSWTVRVARRHGLESTLRDPWRPWKAAKKEE